MAITIRKFIDIVSGVGAGIRVASRDLTGRIFTRSERFPVGAIIDFGAAEEVAAWAGADSEEYLRAAFYFGFISKTQVRAKKLSFVRWPGNAVTATLRATQAAPELEAFKAVTDGSFVVALDKKFYEVKSCDFSGATSYADVAAIIETAVRKGGTTALWKGATVHFEAVQAAFTLNAGTQGACSIAPVSVAQAGTYIGGMLGWDDVSGVVSSEGRAAQSVTELLNESTEVSNNFGSFLFMGDLTLPQAKEAAMFADNSNIRFMYTQRVREEDAEAWHAALKGYAGVALTEYRPDLGEFPEMAPMILLAATDYTRLNGTLNYMFHQFNLNPTVSTTRKSNELDALRVNYYGRTQQAGQTIDFYQRGVLMGSVLDMNIYANEMWLKDRVTADILTLLLVLPKVSANDRGRSQVIGALENVIELGLKNGTISIGKDFTYAQKVYVTEITGDPDAWRQLRGIGYWLSVEVAQITVDDRVEYIIKYLLVYSKDDIVRKVEGTHSLI